MYQDSAYSECYLAASMGCARPHFPPVEIGTLKILISPISRRETKTSYCHYYYFN